MSRTESQKIADDNLTKAVEDALKAYGMSDDGNSLSLYYMVLVERRHLGPVSEGEDGTGIARIFKDNEMPWCNILGLLRASTLLAEKEWLEEA